MDKVYDAKIVSTWIGIAHGCLSAFLHIQRNDGGGTAGFGGWRLDNSAGIWFRLILETMDLADSEQNWSYLEGHPCRIRARPNGMISAVGHPTKDRWFDLAALLEEERMRKEGGINTL